MSLAKVLRVLIVLEWLFVAAGLGLSFALEAYLPDALQNWLIAESERPLDYLELFAMALGLLSFAVWVVSSVGLFLLKKWASWTYLISIATLTLANALLPTSVEHSIANSFGTLESLISGLILGIAFLTEVLEPQKTPISIPETLR